MGEVGARDFLHEPVEAREIILHELARRMHSCDSRILSYTLLMFKRDALAIRAAALKSQEQTAFTLMFAVATANCPFWQSVHTLRIIRDWGDSIVHIRYDELTQGEKSLMGCGMTKAKLAAYQYIWNSRDSIWAKFLECDNLPEGHLVFWHYLLDLVPGLGMVKAAFSVQMLFNKLGCIDIHNARELGYDKAPSGRAKKNRPLYLDIQSVKTSEQFWDDWCVMLAKKYPGQFTSGNQVSALHAYAVIGVEELLKLL